MWKLWKQTRALEGAKHFEKMIGRQLAYILKKEPFLTTFTPHLKKGEKQMKKSLVMYSLLVFTIAGMGHAANSLYWTGEGSFKVAVTNVDSKDGTTHYFYTYNPTLEGTWYVHPGKELDPVKLGSKLSDLPLCLAGFISNDRANEIWIYDGTYLSTESAKSKNEKFVFIGTGIFVDHDAKVSAAAYLDASGTHKQDTLGKTLSIVIKGMKLYCF